MNNRAIRVLILAVLLTALIAGMANCASFTYASQRKEIKAGVLIFPDAPNSGSYSTRSNAPYLFQVINQRSDVKPQGWDFVNPLAPSRVTDEIIGRWLTALGGAYVAGSQVTKDMGCYWEVRIGAGLQELAQFDILYVGLPAVFNLTRTDREKLRKVVDAGGVLWIENDSPGGTAGLTSFFVPDVLLNPGGGMAWAGAPNPMHPLVHRPFDLSWDEMSRLGTDAAEISGSAMHRVGSRGMSFGPNGDQYFMTAIGLGGSIANPIMAGAQYGSGHIIASAESIGFAVSIFGSAHYEQGVMIRNGKTCPADGASMAPAEDVKAAVNIMSWGGEHTGFHKDPRHTGYSFDEIGAPLALKWMFDRPAAPIATGSSPAMINDMVFYVDGGGFLHAFDLSPAQDLNGDGSPDDGNPGFTADYSAGFPYDELWNFGCGSTASSPTVAYVPVTGGAAVPAVFVTTQDGRVLAFEAVTGAGLMGDPVIMNVNVAYSQDDATGVINIPAPTYFDGVVYVGNSEGVLLARNLLNGTGWQWPATPGMNLPRALNSPTVGFFRNPITGSVDQLVYLATRGRLGSINGCVYSFPIKVFNEVLTAAPGVPGSYRVRKYQTMAIKPDPATFELYYSVNSGTLSPIDDSFVSITQPGTFVITTAIPSGASVIADYEVDTDNGTYPPNWRQRIEVKNRLNVGQAPEGYGVISTPAGGSNDTLYYGTENGSFYAVLEDGWGITTKWRWYLGDPGVQSALGIATDAKIIGSPAVGNDKVYFAVNSGSRGYILAFDSDPVFRISVGGMIDSRRPVEVTQYDSMNPGREPVALSGASEGSDTTRRRVAFKVDYDKGRITIENFLDPLSASQNLIVRFFPPTNDPGPGTRVEQIHSAFPGASDVVYDDYWNNLAWCMEIPPGPEGVEVTSSPMLMGGMLYVGDSRGKLHALNVHRIGKSVAMGHVVVADDFTHWIWPDKTQPPLGGGAPILSTVGGSQGNIAISSAEGLAVLHNALTLISDNHRVLEMDASGQVVWSCDSTSAYAATRQNNTNAPVYAAEKKPFNRPAVARRIGTSNILVADTGNNRVVLIDRAGNALCEIPGRGLAFLDPNGILPPDSPKTLSTPTDAWMSLVQGPTPGSVSYDFLIADTGNFRVVEIKADYNPATGRYDLLTLVWATRTLEQGKRYRYISARRYPKVGVGTETICVVDNLVPESDKLETTGGAIVTIDDTTGLVATNGVRRYVDTDGYPVTPPYGIKIVNPTFFSREIRTNNKYTDIIGDANGLYAVDFVAGEHFPSAQPKWYRADMHPRKPLVITHAQLLPSGNVLITNGASSLMTYDAQVAQGEVFEISRDFSAIVWPNPGVKIGQGSYPLEQPTSAERLFQ